ncbi:hypothetical protein B0I72DRAFT_40944 [Yarrowia lipolytica]|nr:hypothetical protein B0I72DRAFT_40944 [Yarrowia lipolytica]RDW37749.1 hypothetical protein B0I73DRAFT_4208 [Yarrowia lipolytica]RDW43551.1 hypothetical protein B0I74DRAFT_8576 [Yarrowia lipolytica]RDW50367.1 hypothetical protein B0I75DRAFT_6548 [Yarrowia lipolytica]
MGSNHQVAVYFLELFPLILRLFTMGSFSRKHSQRSRHQSVMLLLVETTLAAVFPLFLLALHGPHLFISISFCPSLLLEIHSPIHIYHKTINPLTDSYPPTRPIHSFTDSYLPRDHSLTHSFIFTHQTHSLTHSLTHPLAR